MKPTWNLEILLKELKNGIRYQNKVGQKDFLEQCSRRRVYPQDITSLAKRIIGREDRIEHEKKRLIRLRINEKKEEIRIANEQWTEESKRVREILKLSSGSNNRVNQIKTEELRMAWTRNVDRLKRKFEAMNQKQIR